MKIAREWERRIDGMMQSPCARCEHAGFQIFERERIGERKIPPSCDSLDGLILCMRCGVEKAYMTCLPQACDLYMPYSDEDNDNEDNYTDRAHGNIAYSLCIDEECEEYRSRR